MSNYLADLKRHTRDPWEWVSIAPVPLSFVLIGVASGSMLLGFYAAGTASLAQVTDRIAREIQKARGEE